MNNYRCGCSQPTFAARDRACGSGCNNQENAGALPDRPVVAMAYVPFQTDVDVYPVEKALLRGTAFPILDKPFLAGCMQ